MYQLLFALRFCQKDDKFQVNFHVKSKVKVVIPVHDGTPCHEEVCGSGYAASCSLNVNIRGK
jgi:hypothetical protein